MKAGLENQTYAREEFLEKINAVSLDELTVEECRRDVESHRNCLNIFAQRCDNITIRNFHPDREDLVRFVNTTFLDMYKELHDIK